MRSQIDKVIRYYNATRIDYKYFWTGPKDLAMHFGYYDSSVKTHTDSLLKINQILANLARISSTDRVLDAGCGFGGTAIWLAENIYCKVIGLTIVPYQIERAKKNAMKSNMKIKLNFLEADYSHSNLPGKSFNVVMGLESIVHCEKKAAFIKEAFRLLTHGGRILISEYMLRDKPYLSRQEQVRIEPWLKAWAMPNLLTSSQYKNWMHKAGFHNIEIHDLSDNIEPSLRRLSRLAEISLPFVWGLSRVGLINPIRLSNIEANCDVYKTFIAGLWRYQVVVGTKS